MLEDKKEEFEEECREADSNENGIIPIEHVYKVFKVLDIP